MAKGIVWSASARKDFSNILIYLNDHWGAKIAHQFAKSTLAYTIKTSRQPKLFSLISAETKTRKCVLNKQNTLFYTEKDLTVHILRIFDTRQTLIN